VDTIVPLIILLLLISLLVPILYIRINGRCQLMTLLSGPSQVNVGDRFKIDLRIVNPSKDDQMVEMLSLDKEFLDQFNFLGVVPAAKGQASAMGGTGIGYRKLLTPNESMPVELHFEAIKPGTFTGNFSAVNAKLITGKAAKTTVSVK
jgi:hypothetical protein